MVKWSKVVNMKKAAAVVLSAMLAIPMLSGIPTGGMDKVSASTMPTNPKKAANGVVTWDCVYYGRYSQSSIEKQEAIKWRVLQVDGNNAFLMADTNLDVKQYEKSFTETSWATSYLRSWLNGYGSNQNLSQQDCTRGNFINSAFTATEQEALLTTTVAESANPTNAGIKYESTSDKIYILSYEEATNGSYGFSTDPSVADPGRVRVNTAYIKSGGSAGKQAIDHVEAAGQPDSWRLRTPGSMSKKRTLYVSGKGIVPTETTTSGLISYKGYEVDSETILVCPVLHIDLSKTAVWSYAGTVSSDGKTTAGEEPPKVDTTEKKVDDTETQATYVTTKDEDGNVAMEYKASNGNEEVVVVPESITQNGTQYKVVKIADGAFKNNKKLKTVVMGSNVTTIGKDAFYGCSNLKTVTIGKNVKEIGARAFYKCTSISSIVIPANVNKIGKQAFFGCKKLKKISFKTTKLADKKVGSQAFKGTHKKAVFKVSKKKLAAYKKWLKKKGAGSKAKYKKL